MKILPWRSRVSSLFNLNSRTMKSLLSLSQNSRIMRIILLWFLFSCFGVFSFTILSKSNVFLPIGPNQPSKLDLDELFVQKMKVEMGKRRIALENVCSRERLGRFAKKGKKPTYQHPPTPNYEVFYFDQKDRLAWCPTYKCASTSWLHNFCLLTGMTNTEIQETKIQLSTLARKYFPSLEFQDGEKAMNESKVKFFIVRHPLERILSAYRDKLENRQIGKKHGTMHFYKSYGEKITKKYRRKVPPRENDGKFPNRYNQAPHKIEWGKSQTNSTLNERAEPTFKEFVTYLTDINIVTHADDHWIPYYVFCTPCLIQYDAIAKFETLAEDQRYIIKLAKLEDKIKPEWKHLTKGKQTSQLAKEYYSTIPRQLLLKLYNSYRLDFEMFEYTIDEYLRYTH